MTKWEYLIPDNDPQADRADKYLIDIFLLIAQVRLSRNQIQKLIDSGKIHCNGAILTAASRFQPGDKIEFSIDPPRAIGLVPEDNPVEVLYSDSDIVVVNKPPGMTVHPSETQMEGTLVHALLHQIRDLSGIGGVLRPGIVHRIDKNTSGALVITKTDEAHLKMSEIFAKHDIERVYWAFCYGVPKLKKGTIDTLIGRHATDRKKFSSQVKEGKRAITHYQLKEEFRSNSGTPFASLIEAKLETGRTHQVRVHLSSIGNSLLGDPTYGAPSERHPKWLALPTDVRAATELLPGQALHARVLGFNHPRTGEFLRFEAACPPALNGLINALKNYSTLR